ncbi:MAG TPA: ribosome maturation factor RimM [Acidimicrobiales bacterium]
MGPDGPLLEIGRVAKAHGLTGEVAVDLWGGRSDRLAPGTVFTTDGGDLQVATARAHQGRYLVRFDGVADRSAAEALRGRVLRAEPIDDPDTLWVHELVGADVVALDGRRLGRVAAVEANPASDLLVLDGGGLIPLRFVTDHRAGETVTVDVPDGLLEP